jgi:hypothetical protein
VVAVPGFSEALLYAFKDDNQGPPSAVEVAALLACVREHKLFPSAAALVGSTFDAFIGALSAHPTAGASLPVVTEEMGDTYAPPLPQPTQRDRPPSPRRPAAPPSLLDHGGSDRSVRRTSICRGVSWIYGAQSDPKKMKQLRLMMRARTNCSACDQVAHSDAALVNFSRLLLKPTEHTFVSRAFPSRNRTTLTEIYLCHASSDHEIEDGNARAGAPRNRWRRNREPAWPNAVLDGLLRVRVEIMGLIMIRTG